MADTQTPESSSDSLDADTALLALRQQIDSIDQQIQVLINQRAACAQQVAEVKLRCSPQHPAVFYRPEREAQVLRRVMERNDGPLPGKDMARLFREIMSVCLALEQPLNVAYPGPEGSYTEQAVRKHFGFSVKGVAMSDAEQAFKAVEQGHCHYAVTPVESTHEGLVSHTLDLFRRYDLRICGEVELVLDPVDDKSLAADTRYLVLGKQYVAPSGKDKTSILLSMRDQPGVLHDVLGAFRQRSISLTRLESRTLHQGQEHYSLFYIDFEGHQEDAPIKGLLSELSQGPDTLKVLGSYPRAVL
ncbi:MAG: chorismate mutase [Nitrincola lacisaponensis]|uniref:Bifunctional chorismate mutase/prephenate dehydratase n=1 Tax=Nitrincola lacisaponensis TaxID=267850 RepID=A0A063Y7Y5_9GAMM|nr:chorismate mutase [Nitrincola lacisaponensis]KDE40861.1 Chorismate mutase I [Nitrincola lacisaponensis]